MVASASVVVVRANVVACRCLEVLGAPRGRQVGVGACVLRHPDGPCSSRYVSVDTVRSKIEVEHIASIRSRHIHYVKENLV